MLPFTILIMITICSRSKVESRELSTSVPHILIVLSSLLDFLCIISGTIVIKYSVTQSSHQFRFLPLTIRLENPESPRRYRFPQRDRFPPRAEQILAKKSAWSRKMWIVFEYEQVTSPVRSYCTAHVSWDVTGYQGLFCPSNKPVCDR